MPMLCSLLFHRGPSKDVLNEVERNLHDAMGVARNIAMDKRLVAGGGAVEMAVSRCNKTDEHKILIVSQWISQL